MALESNSKSCPPRAVKLQLARIVASHGFRNCPRMQRFLTIAVERALAGREETLKEYALAADVFDRDPAFDPRTHSIVRVEARRLRRKLLAYYATDGACDPIEITLPTGSYVPQFYPRPQAARAARRPVSAGLRARLEQLQADFEAADAHFRALLAGVGPNRPDDSRRLRLALEAKEIALITYLHGLRRLSGELDRQGWRVEGRPRIRGSDTAAASARREAER